MKTTKAFIIHSFVLLFIALTLHGQSVDLYLQPDLQSEKLQTVDAGDPRLGSAAPVPDEVAAAIGWHYAEFNGIINGYVPDAKIGKDLFPVENAIIYSRPTTESPVITTYHLGDELEIVDTGAWWEVRLTTSFPVYFIVDASPALLDTSTVIEEPLIPVPATDGTTALLPEKPLPVGPADVTGQGYQGIFRKSKKGLGLFKPRTPFFLQDPSGDRIAWIDTSGWIGSGTLQGYLDKPVLIYGIREFDDSTKEWIIHVRNMRIK